MAEPIQLSYARSRHVGLTPRMGFWRRQFRARQTSTQRQFDLAFGLTLPIFCLIFDPIFLRPTFSEGPVFGGFSKLIWWTVGFELTVFSVWFFGKPRGWLAALLVGPLFAGAVVAAGIGVVMLPFSIAGLIVLFGALGFAPLATAFVFARSAVLALRRACRRVPARRAVYSAIALCLLVLWTPVGIHVLVQHYVLAMIPQLAADDYNARMRAIASLGRVSWIADFEPIASEATTANPQAPDRKEHLWAAYVRLTGRRQLDGYD